MWILIACVAVAGLLYILYKRSKRGIKVDNNQESKSEKLNVSPKEALNNNAVYMFGKLTVTDSEGQNITYRLSSKLKQTLVLMLLYSRSGGVTTDRLSTSLWVDKSPPEAKNIRGVTINHLRTILADMQGVEVVHEDGKWHVGMSEEFYCDLFSALALADNVVNSAEIDTDSASKFLKIVGRGVLLDGFVQYEWYESLKIEIEDKLHGAIEKLLPYYYNGNKYNETIHFADVLFAMDSLSESALHYKTKALRKRGKNELAMAVQTRFEQEYRESYGKEYRK